MTALVAKPAIELNTLVDRVRPHHHHLLNSSGFERSNLKATLLRHHPWLNGDSADCAINCIL
ncbi:hypothetical protein IQ263_23640 [Tychonema sp. LEGE 06208]|uniref:hypothetical protein n=1 Tax=Tychonema sp. LEGE 06208 TaxID=1828663 RepID=UPI00187E12D9|nr:hypothetical protein [Tychonema sp. LEGE 06208]